jgi:dTDP-4-dehydrorhamnose reductase
MKNILFFGATGKLGRHWSKHLSIKNKVYYNIHLTKEKLKSKNLINVKFDFNKRDEIYSFCKKNNINLIISCVGLANVEVCQFNKKNALKVNYSIPAQLCRIAKKLDILFVHISTDMLFDGKSKKKYTEKSKYSPTNQYSKTKVKAEKFILKYKKSLIIRANFFGFGWKNNRTFSDKLIHEQKLKKKSFLWNDINFTPIYIPNLIFFINLLIKKKYRGIFNISSNKGISKFNFGLKIIKKIIKNNKIFANSFDAKKFTFRPKNMCLSNKKLKKIFKKYKNKLSLEYQIKSFIKDYKKNYE